MYVAGLVLLFALCAFAVPSLLELVLAGNGGKFIMNLCSGSEINLSDGGDPDHKYCD